MVREFTYEEASPGILTSGGQEQPVRKEKTPPDLYKETFAAIEAKARSLGIITETGQLNPADVYILQIPLKKDGFDGRLTSELSGVNDFHEFTAVFIDAPSGAPVDINAPVRAWADREEKREPGFSLIGHIPGTIISHQDFLYVDLGQFAPNVYEYVQFPFPKEDLLGYRINTGAEHLVFSDPRKLLDYQISESVLLFALKRDGAMDSISIGVVRLDKRFRETVQGRRLVSTQDSEEQASDGADKDKLHVIGGLANVLNGRIGQLENAPQVTAEAGVVRNAAGQVIQISGVNHVPFGSYRDPKPATLPVKGREQASILAKYDRIFDALEFRLIGSSLSRWGTVRHQDLSLLEVRGDKRFQAILDEVELKKWPALLLRQSRQEMRSNVVEATVLSRTEKDPRYIVPTTRQVDTICFSMENPLGEVYRKVYIPKPQKVGIRPGGELDVWNAPPNAAAEWMSNRLLLGDLGDIEVKGVALEGAMLFALSEDGVIHMDDARLPKGWQQFFYRSGSMFSRQDAQKLQNALVGPESSYVPTPQELKLVDFLESYPRAALEEIKGNITKHPDTVNGRVDLGTKDRLTVVLGGLDVNQLAADVSSGSFHFSALDRCLIGGKDSLFVQVDCPEGEDAKFVAAVVRPVEGKNQYAESLLSSRLVIEAYQKNCPGFSASVLRRRINNEFANSLAFAHIVSRLAPAS